MENAFAVKGSQRRDRRSVRPLLGLVLDHVVFVCEHEVIRNLTRGLGFDDTFEHVLALDLAGLGLHVGDLRREHDQLADQLLAARELDDVGGVVLGQEGPVEVLVIDNIERPTEN